MLRAPIPNIRCYSFLGRQPLYGQPQGISLSLQYCVTVPVVVHEIGHAIGFYHEHQRPDRDQYVTINKNSIQNGKEHAFDRKRTDETTTLGYGYDYASIMHYHRSAFTKHFWRQTIVAKDEGVVFGRAKELSPLDILKANKLYKCGKLAMTVICV